MYACVYACVYLVAAIDGSLLECLRRHAGDNWVLLIERCGCRCQSLVGWRLQPEQWGQDVSGKDKQGGCSSGADGIRS